MANSIDASQAYINAMKQAQNLTKPQEAGTDAASGVSFGALLKESAQTAMDAQYRSEQTSARAIVGKADMSEVLQAVNDADIALNTVLALRDRLVQAYQEIMRTPI